MIDIAMKLRSPDDLFDAFDPSPLERRRLNDAAASYLLATLKAARAPGPAVVTLCLPEASQRLPADDVLQAAVPAHFQRLSEVATADIKRIRLIGRVFVPIGFVIMCFCMLASELLTTGNERHVLHSIAEGILVLGWVALWAPFEHLLFGRLPVMRERSFYRQLANAQVRIEYTP